jgi:DNA polymerase-1
MNAKFDNHMVYAWGVDLEKQGCSLTDVAHYAALLDDHRFRFNLDSLAKDYLGREKVGKDLDASRMVDYHASVVAPRAGEDAKIVWDLREVMMPLMDAQDLQRVRQLEDDVIYPVCETERNGAPLDLELLEQWVKDSEQDMLRLLFKVSKVVGFTPNPDKSADWERIFDHLGIPIVVRTAPSKRFPEGQASFTEGVIKLIDHPVVQDLRKAGKLASLRSKYLLPYQRHTKETGGILRYNFHQLRSDDKGTVSGRFSSTDVNIQQVMGVDRWVESFGSEDYLVRKLFIPKEGYWLSADAKQIEYRGFAHYANSPRINKAYAEDPDLSFHKLIHGMLLPYKPQMLYKAAKDLNFAKIYGAGLVKRAMMMGFITEDEAKGLRAEYKDRVPSNHPKLKEALEIDHIYQQEIPEAGPLLSKAKSLAEQRGYVKTILGRRSRFPDGQRSHKALNAVIQGTAADINKMKLRDLHAARATTGFLMRMTVHDEVCGDVPDQEAADRVAKILNEQAIDTRIPILWDVEMAANWAGDKGDGSPRKPKEKEHDRIAEIRETTGKGLNPITGTNDPW